MQTNSPFRIVILITAFLTSAVIFLEYCKTADNKAEQNQAEYGYVGDSKCQSCHAKEFDLWKSSDHYKAMLPANDTTVVGNFSNSSFTADGVTSHFFRKDGKYIINTQGPDGSNHDYEVLYTFGYKPLQQYLVAFPGGRMQVPRVSWDVNSKKWFHQYPDQKIQHSDWLHWTGGAQNWNTMCASCHSTDLKKNYFSDADSFHTTYAVMNVSCESCHGPASRHVSFMEKEYKAGDKVEHTFLNPIDTPNLVQINTCAPCHARKADLTAEIYKSGELMNNHIPEIPTTEFFHADGQVDDEDYTYTSFLQSKMFRHGVKCSNCHDPHSGKTLYVANQTCLQCHEKKYDQFDHHRHDMADADVAREVTCVSCHMPSKFYMGNDLRHDHSFRVPRPDLTVKYGTPNACTNCHEDKKAEWSANAVVKWYGANRKYHFADDLIPGSKEDRNSEAHLLKLMSDTSVPDIVKASAIHYLRNIPTKNALSVLLQSLRHPDAQIRYRALRSLPGFPVDQWRDAASVALADKVKAVRIAAADILLEVPGEQIRMDYRSAFGQARRELEAYVMYQADFAVGSVMIGDYFYRSKDLFNAEKYYRKGLRKDSLMNYARFNLSSLLNVQGKNAEALKVLEEARVTDPQNERVYYNLALLYAELNDTKNAMASFAKAISLGSTDPRIYYNYGLLQQQNGKVKEAEDLYLKGLNIAPGDASLNYALAFLYMQLRQPGKAMAPASVLKKLDPGNPNYAQLFRDLRL
jgi:tetratricopeptide (TPR) repeat protein